MKILYSLDELKVLSVKNIILTIGMFDGVHLGHQKILGRAKKIAEAKESVLLVITFSNHPKEVLSPDAEISVLTPIDKKLALLETYGIDIAVVLIFSKELSALTSGQFLSMIHAIIPFTDLVLGYDATIGSDQENNSQNVLAAISSLNAHLHRISAVEIDDSPISSRRVRNALAEGDITTAEMLLGHSL